ncbi:hypothetical protein [Pseudarthrobacter oxydans]|uniref:hypothetical protein n=1 Tax=Pseudarthrobacter oxydans TaxID=1671 RepID=UPI0035E7E1F3
MVTPGVAGGAGLAVDVGAAELPVGVGTVPGAAEVLGGRRRRRAETAGEREHRA